MDDKERRIVAEMAYKAAVELHVHNAAFDREALAETARQIANDVIKIAGGPSSDKAGGSSPQPSPRGGEEGNASPPPSCPRCDAPMDLNNNWTGLGDYEGHKASESIEWRCSQRGRFVKGQGWEGCDGARWRDLKVEGLPHKAKAS